jgi:pimeloyl-ACP methyl ester carboxylesterase
MTMRSLGSTSGSPLRPLASTLGFSTDHVRSFEVAVRALGRKDARPKSDSDTTLLLLAPWPESVWAFRRIWRQVAGLGRVVAIDLPGFGHSDQSRPELIAPDTTGAFLERLIDEWGLGAPHIVGPDVGTAAALFLAAKAPERVTSLTIGGGAVRFPIDAGGALKDVIEAPSLDVVRALDARTNISYAVSGGYLRVGAAESPDHAGGLTR